MVQKSQGTKGAGRGVFFSVSKGQACRFAHEEVSRPRSQFACDDCDHCFKSEVALAQHWQNRHQRPQVQAAAKGSGKAAFAAPTPGVPQRNTPSGGAYVVEECETEAVDPAAWWLERSRRKEATWWRSPAGLASQGWMR